MKSGNLPLWCGANSSGVSRKMSDVIMYSTLSLDRVFYYIKGGIAYGKSKKYSRD